MCRMKKLIYGILLCMLFVYSSCTGNHKKKIIPGGTAFQEGKLIKLSPEQSKTINLSDIVKKVEIKILEMNDNSLISNILKIEIDKDYFIQNDVDKFVYFLMIPQFTLMEDCILIPGSPLMNWKVRLRTIMHFVIRSIQ